MALICPDGVFGNDSMVLSGASTLRREYYYVSRRVTIRMMKGQLAQPPIRYF
jgi:hypothetical protein